MIISICHCKGGTGKTTVSTGVACELERLGHRTLLIDADPQGSASDWRAVAQQENGLPSVVGLAKDTLHRPGQVDRLSSSFDVTVIDCPPALGKITRSALMSSDVVLIPSRPNAIDLWALEDTLNLIADAKTFNERLRAWIVVSQKPVSGKGADAGTKELRKIGEESEAFVLKTALHFRVAYSDAMLNGSYPVRYEPDGKAAREVRTLVKELLEVTRG